MLIDSSSFPLTTCAENAGTHACGGTCGCPCVCMNITQIANVTNSTIGDIN
jgi:hypothetical protein